MSSHPEEPSLQGEEAPLEVTEETPEVVEENSEVVEADLESQTWKRQALPVMMKMLRKLNFIRIKLNSLTRP